MVSIATYVQHIYGNKSINPSVGHLIEFVKAVQGFDFSDTKKGEGTSDYIVRLKQILGSRPQYITSNINSVANFEPITFLAKREDAHADLTTIKAETENFTIRDVDAFYFIKEIKTYYPERDVHFSFGKFGFYLFADKVYVETHSGNTRKNGEYHPYVKGNNLCLGQYLVGYKSAYKDFRFYDAYKIVMDLMTIYGGDDLNGTPNGPHNPFHLWIGSECEVCGGSYDLEEMYPCTKTKLNVCKKCIAASPCKDENTGDIYLPQYIAKCESCGKNAANVKNNICGVCRRQKV